MKKYTLLLAFFGLLSTCFCQSPNSRFLNGFVITTAGDTLRGRTMPSMSTVKILIKPAKKAIKIKHKDIVAYRYGRYTYHNIHGYYRLVVDGSVCLYIKDVNIPKTIVQYKTIGQIKLVYLANMTYYVVKRREEEEVTVLQTLRSGNFDASLEGIAAEIATNLVTDQLVNGQTTMLQAMRKIAAEYFKDCPELVEDLEDKSKYTTHNSIHRMVERYNNYVVSGSNKD